MGKKTKSKARLDKFYRIAKEQGYRSRAAFKLIQLNRKYHFLNSANVLVDLCAAPGGWLQVATRYMPVSSIKIGIDLVSIKSVPGCVTFQEDITSARCLQLIKKEVKGNKVDVVLNDGAPNVGSAWNKDAFSQSELVLAALKLATTVLRKGGTFVTKIFRSADYNSLIWVMNKFFEKVEATKPEASRTQSAEIFVVGLRYIAPDYIDPKLFDVKHIFKDTEADLMGDSTSQIDSTKKLFEKRRHREGYDDDMPMHMHRSIHFDDFMFAENPIAIFAKYNKIAMTEEEKEKYLKLVEPPEDYLEMFEDLKVLGKREVNSLLRWRGKLMKKLHRERKKEAIKDEVENGAKEDGNATDSELEEELEKEKHRELKESRREREKKLEMMTKNKMAAPENVYNNEDDVTFDFYKGKKDISKLKYIDLEEENETPVEPVPKTKESNLDDVEANIEHLYEIRQEKHRKNEEKRQKKLEEAKKKKKFGQVDEEELKAETFQRPDHYDDLDEEDDDEIVDGEYDVDEEQSALKMAKNAVLKSKFFDRKIFKEGLKSENPDELPTLVNPIKLERIKKTKQEEEEKQMQKEQDEQSSESEIDPEEQFAIKPPTKEFQRRKKKLLEHNDNVAAQLQKEEFGFNDEEDTKKYGNGKIEIVPELRFEDYDMDSLAEMRALATKMLRKKDRDQIINDSYNRYSRPVDEDAPEWFLEDERKHSYKTLPITKEEYQAEKQRLLALENKAPKKIIEAKIRKKFQIQKKLKKAQQKAKEILDQEGVNEGSKMRQVHALYNKALSEAKKDKKYIVSRRFNASENKGRKVGRMTRVVDRRLKKDKRAVKIAQASKKIKKGKMRFAKRRRGH